jgi:hypothetical protein
LTRGKALITAFELTGEITASFDIHTFNLSYRLHDIALLQRLAYLADMFTKMEELNLCLLDKDATVISARVKIVAIKGDVEFWCSNVKESQLSCFPTPETFL